MSIRSLVAKKKVSTSTAREWIKRGCPHDESVTVDQINEWHKENVGPRPGGAGGEEVEGLREQKLIAEIAKLNEEIRAKSLENSIREGEFVESAKVEAEYAEHCSVAQPLLEAMVDEIAKASPQELRVTMREIAQHHAHLFFRKFSSWRGPNGDS